MQRMTHEIIARCVLGYACGHGLTRIAGDTGFSRQAVASALRRRGVQVRPRGRPRKRRGPPPPGRKKS